MTIDYIDHDLLRSSKFNRQDELNPDLPRSLNNGFLPFSFCILRRDKIFVRVRFASMAGWVNTNLKKQKHINRKEKVITH
jgi:hypothetical protein